MKLDTFSAWWQAYVSIITSQDWILDVSLILIGTAIFFTIWRALAKRIEKIVYKVENYWGDVFWHALWQPINWLIALWGISMIAVIAANALSSQLIGIIYTARELLINLFIVWILFRFTQKAEIKSINQGRNETTVSAIAKLAKISLIIFAILATMQVIGFSISGILAFGGMGGLIVGIAAKDLLANFFGALVIYLDRPFNVGNWIRLPDRGIEGTVENIGWRQTLLRTFDKRSLYVPNAIFASVAVENPSRMTNRRIKETIGVRYDDCKCLKSIICDIKSMLNEHVAIDHTKTLMVNFDEFGPSSLNFFIYTFTKTTDWVEFHQIKQEILFNVMNIIEQQGGQIAFPTQTVYINTDASANKTNNNVDLGLTNN